MENKINIAELLKDCPEGMELDCAMYDNVQFDIVQDGNAFPIKINTPEGRISLSKYGCYSLNPQCKCVIFPKGKTTWEGFHRPFVDGDIVAIDSAGGSQVFIFEEYIRGEKDYAHCYLMLDDDGAVDLERGEYYVERFATEKEKEKLFKAIKDNGYEWNAETKTLEKLTPNKFDVNTLKPFESRVLVRDTAREIWKPDFFGCLCSNDDCPYMVVGGIRWKCCIPFEGNEHLLGKTDNCIDFYKTWE